MAPLPGMETLAARLGSFENKLQAPKRRGSNAKGQKTISWPHDSPSPEQLAEAGLYYNPSASSPDNTMCFLCERQFAGWEDEDEPVVEHLKLSRDCGWAIIKNAGQQSNDPSTMEDPTIEKLYEARKSTFGSRWPHEHKRGWVCKTEKMAAAGWHFAPTPEFEDFVSCAYCNLSLDGWEPKDSPFEEHYRRSPGCPFFIFAGTTAPKPGRSKKARTSKASRLSTQSNATIASQAPSIPDMNDSINVSNISQDTILSTSTMGTKKGGRGKGKSTQVKKAEPVEVVETIEVMAEESPAENADPTHRGTKRKSDAISDDRQEGRESTVVPEPSPKRRLTRSRNSETQQIDYPVLDVVKPAPVKSVRGGRKRASSTARKASATSRATTASLRSVALDDAEIDAALEADLDKPMPDKPADESDTIEEPPKPKSRGRTKKTNASAAPTRSTRQATAELESSQVRTLEPEDVLQAPMVGQKDKDVGPKGKARKGRAPKKTGNKDAAPSVPNDSESIVALAADSQFNSSLLTAQTMASDSGHETDASVTSQKSITRKGSKRKANTRAKGKKAGAKNIEDIIHSQTGPKVVSETNPRAEQQLSMLIVEPDLPSKDIAEENVEEDLPKKATRATRAGKKKGNATKKEKPKVPQLSMPGMFSPLMGDMDPSFNSVLAPSSPPVVPATRSGLGWDNRIPVALSRTSSPKISRATENKPSTPTNARLSPAGTQTASQQRNPRTNEATPSPSPQSSDAENQPPSSRPPSVRPPLAPLSPTKSSIQRIPLAPGTPKQVPLSPSKIGGLKSEVPWTAVDVEMIFVPSPDKENRNIFAGPQKTELTSPEKAMSVEEWIKSQGNAAEMKLKEEAGRVVGIFEREGGRALRVLEGIDVL